MNWRMGPVLAACLLTGGCLGALLGGGKPDTLYRFGDAPVAPGAVARALPGTVLDHVTFAGDIAGDRVIAVHDTQVRPIAGIRWASAAQDLFAQALMRQPDLALLPKAGDGTATLGLVVDVDRFEARYADAAMTGAPVIVIEGQDTVVKLADRRVSTTQRFAVRVPARQNSGAAVAVAFDTATTAATAAIAVFVQSASAAIR